MTTEGKKCGSFMSMFIPGLVLGLVVGGLAGAFLPPVLDRMGMGVSDTPVSGPVKTPQTPATGERDARITDPAAAPKPAEPTVSTPDPTAAAPADAPRTEPKVEPKVEPKPADQGTAPK